MVLSVHKLPMKYTVSGSTLQYKVGLTLSFLSLISRGVGGNQKGNTSIEVIQFWIPPTPREIRLKKLNVSPTLYCNVLSLTVYFIGMLMYRQNHDLNSHSSPYLIPE